MYSLEYLLNNVDENIYFINILDGNECYNNQNKFQYLCKKDKYKDIQKKIFIGDMKEFYDWYNNEFNK